MVLHSAWFCTRPSISLKIVILALNNSYINFLFTFHNYSDTIKLKYYGHLHALVPLVFATIQLDCKINLWIHSINLHLWDKVIRIWFVAPNFFIQGVHQSSLLCCLWWPQWSWCFQLCCHPPSLSSGKKQKHWHWPNIGFERSIWKDWWLLCRKG